MTSRLSVRPRVVLCCDDHDDHTDRDDVRFGHDTAVVDVVAAADGIDGDDDDDDDDNGARDWYP